MNASDLELLARDDFLLEVGRLAVEDELVGYRDSRLSCLRNNGLVIRERDCSESSVIRFGAEHAISVALKAMARAIREGLHG